MGHLGSISGWGRSPGGGHGHPLQCSCLENPHGERSLAGCSLWSRKESETTGRRSTAQPLSAKGSFLPPTLFYFTSPWATGHHVLLDNPGGQESTGDCSKARDSAGSQQGHYPLVDSITGTPCFVLWGVVGSFLLTNLTKGGLWACPPSVQLQCLSSSPGSQGQSPG